ncbi:hypothetical protein [Humibacter sp.]|uniref:hypothetical protein n=1 Tax=Humibacter sp. TaxID=1940291 RepID=UPI003F8130EF
MGYSRAGFDVYGVDIVPQQRYPFAFHLGDALVVVRRLLLGEAIPFTHKDGTVEWLVLSDFAAIHGSPPCQLYTVANNIHGREHPDLLAPTRELLIEVGLPWVLENVPGSPMENYVMLCGLALGIGVKRHRYFESSVFIMGAPECPRGHPGDWLIIFGNTIAERGHVVGRAKGGGPKIRRKNAGLVRGRKAMEMPWASSHGLSEAIPPAYTEFIGAQLLEALEVAA